MHSLLQGVWSAKTITGDQTAATVASLIGVGNRIIGFLFVPVSAAIVTEITVGSGGDSIFKNTSGTGTAEQIVWLSQPGSSDMDKANEDLMYFPPMLPAEMLVDGTATDLYITIEDANGSNLGKTYIFYVGGDVPVTATP